jgi:hypothetical protein
MYAIVTFGPAPKQRVFSRLETAIQAAERLPDTTTVRVYRCDTKQLASSADISQIRDGETIAWQR